MLSPHYASSSPFLRDHRFTSEPRRRILIVDDNEFFAACLRVVIDNESDLEVCDKASDTRGLTERIHRQSPDLLIIDLALAKESGLAVARFLRAAAITTSILFVSSLASPSKEQMEQIGSCSFVPKNGDLPRMLKHIRKLLRLSSPIPSGG